MTRPYPRWTFCGDLDHDIEPQAGDVFVVTGREAEMWMDTSQDEVGHMGYDTHVYLKPFAYSHRNGETTPPEVEGYYWWESIEYGWISITNVDNMVLRTHKVWAERGAEQPYRYYGPIPMPTRKDSPT